MLDLDHVGAQHCELIGRKRSRQDVRDVDHPDAFERSRHCCLLLRTRPGIFALRCTSSPAEERVKQFGPHPEERALARVSKDGCTTRTRGHPSRRALKGAPQDEVFYFFTRSPSIMTVRTRQSKALPSPPALWPRLPSRRNGRRGA